MNQTFEEILIKKELCTGLKKMNITIPTKIQTESIKVMMEGKDCIIHSQTGTGKTIAYLLPLYEKLDTTSRTTQAIVLVPTHELALQIQKEAKKLTEASTLPLRSAIIMGNVNIQRQIEALKDKPQLIIGTPGRILELIKKRKISAHTVKTIIIDEADKMLDPRNIDSIQAVIKTTLKDRQLVFASASFTKASITAIESMTQNIVHVEIVESTQVPDTIEHLYIVADYKSKHDMLRKVIHASHPKRGIIFTSQSDNIEVIKEKLLFNNIKISCLYGALKKDERQREIQNFTTGKTNLLLATDVAGRGLHFDHLDYIFNLNIAESPKDYMHRSGRTGRNGNKGTVISVATPAELAFIRKYEKALQIKISEITWARGVLSRKG